MWRSCWETSDSLFAIIALKLPLFDLIPANSLTNIAVLTFLESVHRVVRIVAEIERGNIIHARAGIAGRFEGLLHLLALPCNRGPVGAENIHLGDGAILHLLLCPIIAQDTATIFAAIVQPNIVRHQVV